jgi:hypothetical protein
VTARDRVRRAQYRMLATVALAALLWGTVLMMTVVGLAAGANAVVPLSATARGVLIPLMIVTFAAAAGLVLWRGRAARSIERVALWIEEREPSLNFVLVTAIDETIAPLEQNSALHAAATGTDIDSIVRHAWRHSLGRAAVAIVALGAVLAVLGPGDLLRAAEHELAVRAMPAVLPPMANRLLSLRARITPPAYTRLQAHVIEEPPNVAALVGSRITLEGSGTADGIVGALGAHALSATSDERGWAITEIMPTNPTVLTLRDRGYRRLLALEPQADSAPAVRLHLPARDTTYQSVPKGKLDIDAALSDDIGLDYGYVEYLLSSGSEESFDTKLVAGAREPFANARAARLHTTLDFDTLKLSPGSVIHIRVIAYDYNDVTGPGKGVSETRTLKIAEPADSTSINAAPPLPIDSMWISQRLLNMRTDTLTRARRALSHEEFAHRSSAYSNGQEDIRKRALAVIALLEDNGVGDAFETEASKMLRQAVELMWTAREDLGVSQPDTALPVMKKILKILDDLRLANRYYLRGILKPVAVNIERTRLIGKDSANAHARTPRAELDDLHRALASRIDAAVALARNSPSAAADSLVYIRVSALTSAPALVQPLQHAIDLLRHGAAADSALARARRALDPPSRVLESASDWSGLVP